MHTARGRGKKGREGVLSRALRPRDFADTLGASTGLHDWWRLNADTTPKLGSHPSICNKTPEVGTRHHKSTVRESHRGVIFSIICWPDARLVRQSEKCSRDADRGQEALRHEWSVFG